MNEHKQDLDRVIADANETLEACPDDVDALSRRGWAWLRKKEYDNAIADFDKALCWDADRVKVLNNRGLAFYAKGEHDLAVADYTAAIRRSPTSENLMHFHHNRGRANSVKGKYAVAIEDFNEAIRRDPQYAMAYLFRALAWHNLGDFPNAISDFDFAIRLNSKSADTFHNRGNTWVCLGKFRKAIADFTRAIQLDPHSSKNALTHNSRGIAWNRKGRYAKALADYERALELDPDSLLRRAVLGSFLATCPQRRIRNGRRAVELLTEVCEMTDNRDAENLECLATAHAEHGDFQSAIVVQKKAITLVPNENEKEDMRYYLAMYEAGLPWHSEKPKWRDRWA